MNKELFKKEVSKLVTEYGDKGFTMTSEKAAQWHEFLKGYDDEIFSKAINQYICTNTYSPSMADILKIMRSYTEPKLLDLWLGFIKTLKEVQVLLGDFQYYGERGETARQKTQAIYDGLTAENQRYIGEYRNLLTKAEKYDYNDFEKYERSNYMRFIEEVKK